MATDLEQLLDMGFEEARAKLAVKKSGGRKVLPFLSRVHVLIVNSPRSS